MAEPAMPSKVMDKKLIQTPEGNVVDSDEEWDRCGKWMLHHPHADLAFLDTAWTALQHLLEDGTLILLKATTGLAADAGASIYCFTRPGMRAARRAANAIGQLVDFSGIMYYRLNKQTSRGMAASRFGDQRVSTYMRTKRGGFYTKKNGVWIQDKEDVAEIISPIAGKFCKEKYSGNESLPSTYKGHCFWNLPKNHQCEQNGFASWYLFCSGEDGEARPTEVDRVWLVAKQLLEEGLFVGLTLKKPEEAQCADVRFYLSQGCDVHSRLAACDRIFHEASYRTVMYFTEGANQRVIPPDRNKILAYDYKYTSDGELYARTKYAEEYVFM